jgi:CDP-L-myo-inositol myo-inositolphosphotransferase
MGLNLRASSITDNVPDGASTTEKELFAADTKVTKAVIIAAGNGSRLQGYQNGSPKPLVRVGGIPLLERVILSAKKSGITEFVIVVGYKAALVRKTINARKLGVKITWVRNLDWRRPNGVSLLKAERFVGDKFLLFMSDHIFDPSILRELRETNMGSDYGILCVDRRLDQVQNLDDATKVRTLNDGRMVNLSKSLTYFNAIDIGVFKLTRYIFDALRKSQEEGDESLSGGIRVLARNGKMNTWDIGHHYWQDVDTIPDLRHAERLLLQSTRSKADGIISRTINRRISNHITKYLLKTPISPNQISFFNLGLSLFTAWLISMGKPETTMIGGVLFQLASILDGCDGEVAVIKHRTSKFGALVDTITDNISYMVFIVGATIGMYTVTHDVRVLWLTGAVLAGLILALKFGLQFIQKKNSGSLKVLNENIAALNHSGQKSWYLRLFGILHPLGRRDMFSFLAMLVMLFGNIEVLYWLMMITSGIAAIGISISAATLLSIRPLESIPKRFKRMLNQAGKWLAGPRIELRPEEE